MQHQVQRYSFILLSAFLLASCATPKVADEPVGSKIESIQTTKGNGSLPPRFQRSTTTTLSAAELTVKKVVKGYKDDVISNTSIKITQDQFDQIVKKIDGMDLSKLKSKKLRRAPVGGGSQSVTIKTREASYSFSNGSGTMYPDEIADVFPSIDKLFSRK
jgi:hypothetical protein